MFAFNDDILIPSSFATKSSPISNVALFLRLTLTLSDGSSVIVLPLTLEAPPCTVKTSETEKIVPFLFLSNSALP